MCLADFIIRQLKKCNPWTDHFYDSALDGISSAFKACDFKAARTLVALGATEDADENYISLLLSAMNLYEEGNSEVLIEYFPFYDDD